MKYQYYCYCFCSLSPPPAPPVCPPPPRSHRRCSPQASPLRLVPSRLAPALNWAHLPTEWLQQAPGRCSGALVLQKVLEGSAAADAGGGAGDAVAAEAADGDDAGGGAGGGDGGTAPLSACPHSAQSPWTGF